MYESTETLTSFSTGTNEFDVIIDCNDGINNLLISEDGKANIIEHLIEEELNRLIAVRQTMMDRTGGAGD